MHNYLNVTYCTTTSVCTLQHLRSKVLSPVLNIVQFLEVTRVLKTGKLLVFTQLCRLWQLFLAHVATD